MPMLFSPTIGAATAARYWFLWVRCPACENLQAAVALYFAHYNLVRLHKTLRVTPAMAANVIDRVGNWWTEHLGRSGCMTDLKFATLPEGCFIALVGPRDEVGNHTIPVSGPCRSLAEALAEITRLKAELDKAAVDAKSHFGSN